MYEISPLMQNTNSIKSFKGNNNTDSHKKDKKSDSNNTSGIVIGLAALAAAAIGGILIHKGVSAKKAAKSLEGELERAKSNIKNLFTNVGVKEEELAKRFAEIEKLPKEEQLKEYQKLKQIQINASGMYYAQCGVAEGHPYFIYSKRGVTEYPANVKEALEKGNLLEAAELYEKYIQTLPERYRAKTTGKTIEETISNVFGKESKVKPHTYDLSKEGEEIIAQRDFGGYYEFSATKDGILYSKCGQASELDDCVINLNMTRAHFKSESIKPDAWIQHGIDKNSGKYVTLLQINDIIGNPKSTTTTIGLISKDANASAAQKDLLSLIEHPEKFDHSLIDTITRRDSVSCDTIVNLDYDLVLSAIQSMARG